MKKNVVVFCLLILFSFGVGRAQYSDAGMGFMGQEGGLLMGGVGMAVIDDQTYFTINFRPELAFGKFGIGLNLNLLYNAESGEIRKEDWDEDYDYFRILRYVRWGRKWDPVYARVGTLDAARLGHGFIVNYYTNEASYDNRKIGLAFDLDFGRFGFESVTSNLGRTELIAGRVYYRPLLGIVDIPIIKNFAMGGSYARDFDPDVSVDTDDAVSVFGFDVELPILKTGILTTMLYYDWAQIAGYSSIEQDTKTFGSGQAVGIMASLSNLAGLIDISAKLERRFLGKEFIASFFDPFYEIHRYRKSGITGIHKTDMLIGITEETKGVFGELYGGLLGNKVRLLGMFSRLDEQKNSGILHLAADAPDAVPAIAAHATYDKMGVEMVKDVFTLDINSVARVGLGYKIKPYLILYMDYLWTWKYETDETGAQVLKPQERIEPKLVFSYRF